MGPKKMVNIWLALGTKRQKACVSIDAAPKDLFSDDVIRKHYVCLDGEKIAWEAPLRVTNIKEGSELRAVPQNRQDWPDPIRTSLYGCPNAQNTPGIVPDPMAAEFQSFVNAEV